MKTNKCYDIFISYRRDVGDTTAQMIAQYLRNKGYRVFFDLENLGAGNFRMQIQDIIESSKDFILVLPSESMERLSYDEDWVRQELEYCISNNINIIPIFLNGFSYPKNLPEDITKVQDYQGVEICNFSYFDAAMKEVIIRLLSKPTKSLRTFIRNIFN